MSTLQHINSSINYYWSELSRKYPGFERPQIVPAATLRGLAPTYLKSAIDSDPDSYFLFIAGDVTKGDCRRETACQFFDELFYDKLGMPSSYDVQAGGQYDRAEAIDMEVLPPASNRQFQSYYDEQMERMRAAVAAAGEEPFDGSHNDSRTDDDVIDVEMGFDGTYSAASDRNASERRVQTGTGTAVGMPRKIFFAVDFHCGSNSMLGYDRDNSRLGGRRSGYSRLGRGSAGFLREDGETDQEFAEREEIAEIARDFSECQGSRFSEEESLNEETNYYSQFNQVVSALKDVERAIKGLGGSVSEDDRKALLDECDSIKAECEKCGDPSCKNGEKCGLKEEDVSEGLFGGNKIPTVSEEYDNVKRIKDVISKIKEQFGKIPVVKMGCDRILSDIVSNDDDVIEFGKACFSLLVGIANDSEKVDEGLDQDDPDFYAKMNHPYQTGFHDGKTWNEYEVTYIWSAGRGREYEKHDVYVANSVPNLVWQINKDLEGEGGNVVELLSVFKDGEEMDVEKQNEKLREVAESCCGKKRGCKKVDEEVSVSGVKHVEGIDNCIDALSKIKVANEEISIEKDLEGRPVLAEVDEIKEAIDAIFEGLDEDEKTGKVSLKDVKKAWQDAGKELENVNSIEDLKKLADSKKADVEKLLKAIDDENVRKAVQGVLDKTEEAGSVNEGAFGAVAKTTGSILLKTLKLGWQLILCLIVVVGWGVQIGAKVFGLAWPLISKAVSWVIKGIDKLGKGMASAANRAGEKSEKKKAVAEDEGLDEFEPEEDGSEYYGTVMEKVAAIPDDERCEDEDGFAECDLSEMLRIGRSIR